MSHDAEATAVEIGTDVATVEPHAPVTLFHTDDPVEVVEQATRVANALAAVIQQKGLATKIQGKDHVGVAGWTLLGSMLGVTAVCVATEPVDGGYRATVEARTADGRVVGRADAVCTKFEKRGPWKTADDYARLSMAQTRATSKALKGPLGFVVSLAGFEATPAEEMTFAEPDKPKSRLAADVGPPTVPEREQLTALILAHAPTPERAHAVLDVAGAPGDHKMSVNDRKREINARVCRAAIKYLLEQAA